MLNSKKNANQEQQLRNNFENCQKMYDFSFFTFNLNRCALEQLTGLSIKIAPPPMDKCPYPQFNSTCYYCPLGEQKESVDLTIEP